MTSENPQKTYEQLKRKNRRRLVGASVMVVVAIVLLLIVSSLSHEQAANEQTVQIDGLTTTTETLSENSANTNQPAVVISEQPSVNDNEITPNKNENIPEPVIESFSESPVLPEEPSTHPSDNKQDTQIAKIKPVQTQKLVNDAKQPTATSKQRTQEPIKTRSEPVNVPKLTNTKKLTPQQILNNQAADQVTATTDIGAIVQAGAYATLSQAQTAQKKLATIGIHSNISQSKTAKGTLYRVRTTRFPNQAEAKQAVNRIKEQGLEAIVITQ